MIKFIQNIGDFFPTNYFDEDFAQTVFKQSGFTFEETKEINKKLTLLSSKFERFKNLFIEEKLRNKDKVYETHLYNGMVLEALGYDAQHTHYHELFHFTEKEVIPVRHILYRGSQPHLMIMEMQALIKEGDEEPDGLFEQQYNTAEEELNARAQKYHRQVWDRVFKTPDGVSISPVIINKAISQLFLLEPHLRPKYILLLAGNVLFLIEQEKWFRGSYLQFDLEELFTEATANRSANYFALLYFMLGKESLSPDSNMVLLDQLDEDSHKSAYEVTKDLKEGIIHAVEALANEALYYQKQVLGKEFDETNDLFEQEVKDDCLRIIYRLLFIFYAESREDLDILPSNDPVYNKGYSLEMLRDLEQVPLLSENSRNGYFFHDSLSKLFHVLSTGYRERENTHEMLNRSFRVRHIDSPIFDDRRLHHLHLVKFRNAIWQDIICCLSLSKQEKNKARGRISYANLGINQLGSVYESLLAYRGFYAEADYIEVHKLNNDKDSTYLVLRSRRDDFEEGEILKDERGQDVVLKKGSFVYRLSGRDRQKSASYYTPEVLTRCTVKYTLKPLLEKLEKGEMKAAELLELKLLEPAMGAAAFHNEMINQLAEAYLSFKQKELKEAGKKEWRVEPDRFREELQKVKAYIATNNTYGVDLNPTAIELGKLSLWLNVIHKDMETPFFSNRLAVGNAVVGAWLRVYHEKDLLEAVDSIGRPLKKQPLKEWWETAPRQLEFKPQKEYEKIKHGRKADEIYHFLLPDKNMVPSAGIKILKEDNDTACKWVSQWRKDFCVPLKKSELAFLKKICSKIDELLADYYRFQRTINIQTANKQEIFGITGSRLLDLKSYTEKEQLADQRNRHNAPYFKLKMVMDYWCSLWFWDVREAKELPNRQQYWQDIATILELDLSAVEQEQSSRKKAPSIHSGSQSNLFYSKGEQLPLAEEANHELVFAEAVVKYTNRMDLFDNNQRLKIISQLSGKYFFFHPQLEFLDVFWEKGGFDLIAGNPPWVNIEMHETGIVSERNAEIAIRDYSAPEIHELAIKITSNDIALLKIYQEELLWTETTKAFLGTPQNYILLQGQRNNLYKCVITNSFDLINRTGYIGLIHPESLYDDPSGQLFRKEIYSRLKYHFQFQNALNLFAEVAHREKFGINIYSGLRGSIDFSSINNIFHPSLIDACFVHKGEGVCGGIKIKNTITEEFEWNLIPHKSRIVNYDLKKLNLISSAFDSESIPECTKLVSMHSSEVLSVIGKIAEFKGSVKNYKYFSTNCWNETNAIKNKIILKNTKWADLEKYELILNGPHFYILNPLYKTPKSNAKQKADFDVIDLNEIDESFLPRTNFTPLVEINQFRSEIARNNWFDDYRVCFSRRLSLAGERTLQVSIIPPKASFVDSSIAVSFDDLNLILELAGLCSSLLMDYYIKSLNKGDLYDNTISNLLLGITDCYKIRLFSRTLQLNCLNKYYAPLWEETWQSDFKTDKWSKQDARLKPFNTLTPNWQWSTPLRNWFERRQALVEIDVITSMALGLTLEELILIYNVQFPVLQQNEDDTWYDTKGNIVFTCSKGLVGVGVDRPDWEKICHMKEGETYVHEIKKSELYYGKKVTYYAPFDKCNRVEDYKIAWAHFEKTFKNH